MSYADLPFWKQFLFTCEDHLLSHLILLLWLGALFDTPSKRQLLKKLPLLWLTLPLSHFALSMFPRRLWQKERFCTYLEQAYDPRRTALLLAALAAAFVALNHMQYGVQPAYLADYLLVVAVMAILMTALVFHLTLRDMDLKRLNLQKDMLLRQQLYEQTQEELQDELRAFRHDCRNLLTGLMEKQEDGTFSRSFQELETGFEKRLGEKIRAASQIGNLRIPQIRGLLLHKIAQMAEQHILCHLEVLYPVDHADMDTWDLIRCLSSVILFLPAGTSGLYFQQ